MSGNREAAIMRQSTFVPHSLSLLAGAMAALASTQALAETAGRVSFVTGNVTASTPDGQSRALRRGDAITGGDRIETRGGRLQIRFTDGGFVSLQPNTVFGVDQYLYANKAPEESSLFFSLLRGGMRTITGAIGKVNKQSYKVRTPVATIGIRGTGYRATTDNNRTLVSVGHGLVSVENVFGNITGGAGQNILATNDLPPSLNREGAEIPATGPEGDIEEGIDEAADDEALARDEPPVLGDQVTHEGDSLLGTFDASGNFIPNLELIMPATDILTSSDPTTMTPVFSLAAPIYVAGSPKFIHPKLQALFDQGYTANRGALLKLDNANGPVFDSGTLNFNDVRTLDNLSWGEFTDGTAAIDNLGTGLTASATQFEPYIIGYAAPGLLRSGKATYSLQGHSTSRLNQSLAGTLDNFTITIDFDFALLDLAMGVTADGLSASVTGTDIAVPAIILNGSFNLSSSSNQLIINGSACSSSCSADISGFFAGTGGSQIGSAYSISTDIGTIKGVAALGIDSLSPAASILPDMKAYTLALTPVPSATSTPTSSGGYNDGNPMSASLNGQFDANGALRLATSEYPSTQNKLTNATASVSDIGTEKTLSWGRYHSGSLTYGPSVTSVVLSGPDSLHYVIGQETPSAMMSALATKGGTATYALSGHTTPSASNGLGSSVNGNLAVNFGAATLGVNMAVDMGTATYGVTDSITFSGAQFSGSNLSTTGNGGACASGCGTDISGFFSGQQAEQIGLTYQINDFGSDTIKGAAAFKRGDITPPPL